MLHQHTPPALDAAQAAMAIQAARAQARHLGRRLSAQRADEQDFEQSILLEILLRSRLFDVTRGSWPSFVGNVTRNASGRLAQKHIARDRASASLTDADHRPVDLPGAESINISLDLKRAAPRLPARLHRLLDCIADRGTIAEACRADAYGSTASFYRDLNDLRFILLAEGASLGRTTQFERKKRHPRKRA